MKKLTNHLKNYLAIYLIIISVLIIALIIYFKPTTPEDNSFDTSMFTILDTKGVNELFLQKEPKVLYIGRQGCSACKTFTPTIQISLAKYHFRVYYYDINDLDFNNEEVKKLINNLDMEYELNSKTDTFGNFIGNTPMFVIIKNKKMVYGKIGIIDEETIKNAVSKYGVIENN